MSEGFALTTPAQINAFQALRIVHGLSIELSTGMKLSRGASATQQGQYLGMLPEGRLSKKKALKLAVEYIQKNIDPEYKPSSRVAELLG